MWLRRSKSRFRLHDASSPKFACSSFKDIQGLLSEDESNCSNNKSSGGAPNFLLRTLSLPPFAESKPYRDEVPAPLSENVAADVKSDQVIRIPRAENTIVVYFTSLRVVRHTFEDCKTVLTILRAFHVFVDERDVSMDSGTLGVLRRCGSSTRVASSKSTCRVSYRQTHVCARRVAVTDSSFAKSATEAASITARKVALRVVLLAMRMVSSGAHLVLVRLSEPFD
ncbi:Glutaredoxin domain-containing protein [Forsythia ovata]|uniref:Glutaredoxin domain-containing protein n=1 Tax=Forsythia ovata TaxID=205694 RepID=A0ABD1RJP7_9LAMI